ncbi:Gfo/Idh/MocA family protein [Leptolyngbya sp. FACHB-261]|uniref:Gfo/Idh/MocA family protein n=1 Tax=Leptolyngbya sp. FACHB-261 TaxID=2692806 RepID=UPI001683A230|nr:Gfo/Idh/MocA family oxidoreductase [Leptolyngbya sp. FACHB-261]MBD2104155.1 Gfo/Idh/MocA family oxidoreductase [Leptolyngbya sp. FACHB-261]
MAIGVGVLGTGFGQKVHIPGFQAHPDTQVVAVFNPDLSKAQTIAEQFQIPHACQRIEDLLALQEVEAVSISTPPFLHYNMACAAIEASKHVLCEKPMTLSVTEARDLHYLAQGRNQIAMLDFEFRCHPQWQYFQELLQSGWIGRKRLINISWLVQSRADAKAAWNWYARKDQGGGALGAIGSHSFDYIAWLFGPVKRLCASLSTAVPARPDPKTGEMRPVDADDTATLLLELADGTPCTLSLSSATYAGRGHWVEVYGEAGSLILGSRNLKDYGHGFTVSAAQAGQDFVPLETPDYLLPKQTYPDGRLAPFIGIVDRFVQAIREGKPAVPSFREGVYSQLLMDLTHQSHEQGRWVEVPTLENFLITGRC